MPICNKCGCYFSEKSCPFCTPDDSPDSPVSTIEVEANKTVRIIDPLTLIESIEEVEKQTNSLKESKEAELEKLRGKMKDQKETESRITAELEELESEIVEMQSTIKEKQEKKENLLLRKTRLEKETNDPKSKLPSLKNQIVSKENEISQLKTELGVN